MYDEVNRSTPFAFGIPARSIKHLTWRDAAFVFRRMLLLVACWTLSGQALSDEKTDRVTLENGDHLTCEVKRLDVGKLTVDTDDMGTISIEWDKVARIESKVTFEVELQYGTILYGSLGISPSPAKTSVISDSTTTDVYRTMVIRLVPVKEEFWSRTSGNLSLGASYTKASQIGQLNIGINTDYKGRIYESNLDFNGSLTTQEEEASTERYDFEFGGKRALGDKWYAGAMIGLQRNTELGLDLRFLLGGGVSRNVIQASANRLSLSAALSGNREWTNDYASRTDNLELLTGITHEIYRYDSPKLNFSTNLYVYTNVTNFGRVRGEYQTNLSWEIISDFTWNLSLYDSYDNQPAEGSSKNDWGIVVSFGYSL
jgi:hypothetical protein